MKRKLAWGTVILLIIVALAFNLIIMPYLLMVALGALGFKFNFWICFAFWMVGIAIANMFRPNKK